MRLLVSLLFAFAGMAYAQDVAIRNVTVVDVARGALRPAITVLVSGERIAAVGGAEVPAGAASVDGTGKYLIPGLWDMHVHWYDAAYLPLFTANGVTGIRIMWGQPVHLRWRREMAGGALRSPRLALAGPIIDGPRPVWPGSVSVSSEEEGREAVQRTKADGYDFVKVYSRLPREIYFAIADEAKKIGIPFVGHVPVSVGTAEASDAGQKSIEHLDTLLLSLSSDEEAVRPQAGSGRRELAERVLQTYDAGKAAALFAKLKANGTWQVPTFTVMYGGAHIGDPAMAKDPRLRYMPARVRQMWDPRRNFRFRNMQEEDFALRRRVLERRLAIAGEMYRAGVRFLAGTDVLNPYCFPGFSLHDELEWLVKAGLSPLDALRAATLNPAEFLERRADLGAIEPGKLADLVLLDADPLQDIRSTRRIAAVVSGGRLYDRKALDRMLAHIAALADAGR